MDELDQLSEAIEREALVSLHEHCPDNTREELGLHLEPFGDALAAGAENDGSVLLNRVLGFGTLEPANADIISDVGEAYRGWGVERYFFHVYADDLSEEQLSAFDDAGLSKTRGWMKFRRGRKPVESARPTELQIERVGPDRAKHFGRIVATAFGMTPAAGPLLAGLANDDRWYLLVSYDGDEPAGAGALMVDDGVGWLEWGATDPRFRQRGSQGAIMAERLRIADELGCTHVFTETGEAVDGDPQHSYRNIEKAGFQTSVLRQNYAPRR